MKSTLFAFCFSLISIWSSAQSIDPLVQGYWSGELTQAEGGYLPTYIISMEIDVVEGQVSGMAVVSSTDSLMARMEFYGEIHKGGYIHIRESELLEGTKLDQNDWCLKQYSLYFRIKEEDHYLVGFWTGLSSSSVCVPGKIRLKRRPNRV